MLTSPSLNLFQALRLELMKHLLNEQEDRRKQRVARRLEKRWELRVAERDAQISRIQSQYARGQSMSYPEVFVAED